MKYSLTAAALPQPPGSRNQESQHIRLSVLKAAVLVPPQGRDRHRKHQWGRYFQAKLEEPPTTIGEDKIWMMVQHNNTELTRVQGSNPEKPYSMTLDYEGSVEQLEALIDGSEHCEQEVAYHCRRSRLLNTPDNDVYG
ncbi:hypothetical protein STEG23_036461, partial [Scotinomys teguina]